MAVAVALNYLAHEFGAENIFAQHKVLAPFSIYRMQAVFNKKHIAGHWAPEAPKKQTAVHVQHAKTTVITCEATIHDYVNLVVRWQWPLL